MKLLITSDTLLKALPAQAGELQQKNIPGALLSVRAGQSFEVLGCEPFEGAPTSASDDHLYVQLKEPIAGSDQTRWFVYGCHCKLEGNEPGNNPQDKPAVRDCGPKIQIPGIRNAVGVHSPIYYEPKPSNFTWSEFTKGGSRLPVNETITGRIVRVAHLMDDIRAFFGDRPITITSGYRDPISNRNVGGALDSRHMYGDAVDFWIEGLDLVDVFYKLKSFRGIGGLAVGAGFVHVDMRPGAPARWTYPGGPQVDLW